MGGEEEEDRVVYIVKRKEGKKQAKRADLFLQWLLLFMHILTHTRDQKQN